VLPPPTGTTKREAVNLALRHVAGEPLGLDEARSMRGTGWDGDLDEMRTSRA
jgi:Arc/MetJ family transcription regulator